MATISCRVIYCTHFVSSSNTLNLFRANSFISSQLPKIRLLSFTRNYHLLKRTPASPFNCVLKRFQSAGQPLSGSLSTNIAPTFTKNPDDVEKTVHLFSNQNSSKEVNQELTERSSTIIDINSRSRDYDNLSVSSSEYIPEPPVPLTEVDNLEIVSTVLGRLEPTLSSQGLGGWSPIGLIQNSLDWLHMSMGISWWASIVIATVIARVLMFPIYVKVQRNAAAMTNNMPQMQYLQSKITEAQHSGNSFEIAVNSEKLSAFMREKNYSPLKSMIAPLAQAPVFISFYYGLRRMANLPIESFKYGGMWWFTDLTIPDPYFLLPIITSVTLFITIEIGAETGTRMNELKMTRYVLRCIPLFVFMFTVNFSSAVLCYWVTTNGITLIQAAFLKVPKVREALKIPQIIHHLPGNLSKQKGFVDSIKEALKNFKLTRELENRSRTEDMKFRKAGVGPVPKTYAFDPTKQKKI